MNWIKQRDLEKKRIIEFDGQISNNNTNQNDDGDLLVFISYIFAPLFSMIVCVHIVIGIVFFFQIHLYNKIASRIVLFLFHLNPIHRIDRHNCDTNLFLESLFWWLWEWKKFGSFWSLQTHTHTHTKRLFVITSNIEINAGRLWFQACLFLLNWDFQSKSGCQNMDRMESRN